MHRRRHTAFAVLACLALPGGLLLAGLLTVCTGCERQPGTRTTGRGGLVRPPDLKPAYSFAEGLREEHPEITAFMQAFLETCLAGDYEKYRLMVSRTRDPESRERFERIYHALRALAIESIEVIHVPELPPPVYLVTCRAEFLDGKRPLLRRDTNQVAILVFREEGEWRMTPAPGELQPRGADGQPGAETEDAEPELPDYPWENFGG